jgi:molybdenum-dependent DNA-binding transcriptional regulator ModE
VELIKLIRTPEIVQAACEKFGISEKTAWDDIKYVRNMWAEESAKEGVRGQRRDEMRELLRDVVRNARNESDRKHAIAAMKMLVELDGLKEAAKVDVDVSGKVEHDIPGRDKLIAALTGKKE